MERFHQTLKRYLAKQVPARTLPILQAQLNSFRTYYNQRRPHRALHGRTPLEAFNARLKAAPRTTTPPNNYRVRYDHVDAWGRVTLRFQSRLRHIAIGRGYMHWPVTLLVADAQVRVVADDGSLLRELIIDPSRDYQPLRACAAP